MGESMCSYRDIIISARVVLPSSFSAGLCHRVPSPTYEHFPRMTQIHISMKVRIPKKRCGRARGTLGLGILGDKRKVFPASIRFTAKFLSPLGNKRNRNYREITISFRAPTNGRLKIPPRHLSGSKPWRVTSAAAYQYRIVEETKKRVRIAHTASHSLETWFRFKWLWLYRKTLVSFRLVRFFFLLSSKLFVYYRSARTREQEKRARNTNSERSRWCDESMSKLTNVLSFLFVGFRGIDANGGFWGVARSTEVHSKSMSKASTAGPLNLSRHCLATL